MKKIFYLILVSIMFISIGCKSEYQSAIEEGLSTGVVHEELILDMEIGWTRKEFYAYCWDMNKEKKISQGSGNKYARYYVKPGEYHGIEEEIDMLFYGIFDEEDVMVGMDMRMSFVQWAPWNKEQKSDKLIEKMKQYYVHTYGGNEFISINTGKGDLVANVKIDDNRHILMYPTSDKDIAIKIEDLRYKKFE